MIILHQYENQVTYQVTYQYTHQIVCGGDYVSKLHKRIRESPKKIEVYLDENCRILYGLIIAVSQYPYYMILHADVVTKYKCNEPDKIKLIECNNGKELRFRIK